MSFGPMQVLVVGFGTKAEFTGEIAAELRRLRDHDIVRLADLLFVTKAEDGTITSSEASDLGGDAPARLGQLAAALTGFGPDSGEGDQEVLDIAAALLPGTSAAVVILEHRWAIPLREAIDRTDGGVVVDAWLQPSDLEAAGITATGDEPPP